MKIYMKNLKGRLSDSCCLLKDFCQKLLFISFQKKVEINVINSKAVFHISKRATVITDRNLSGTNPFCHQFCQN